MSLRSLSGFFIFSIISTSPCSVSLVILFKFSSFKVTSSFSTSASCTYWLTWVLEVGNCLRYLVCSRFITVISIEHFRAGKLLAGLTVAEWRPVKTVMQLTPLSLYWHSAHCYLNVLYIVNNCYSQSLSVVSQGNILDLLMFMNDVPSKQYSTILCCADVTYTCTSNIMITEWATSDMATNFFLELIIKQVSLCFSKTLDEIS